jgi:Tfp pilus assembly protein PilF
MVIIGCGGSEVDSEVLATAQQSYDQGKAAFDSGDFNAAKSSLDDALKNPAGLNSDIYVDALIKRAISLAIAGDFPAAEVDIAEAERGATEMDQVYLARSILLQQQGDQAGADREMKNAKKANPKLVVPKLP